MGCFSRWPPPSFTKGCDGTGSSASANRWTRLDQPGRRFWLLVRDTAGQGNVIRETWGSLHYAFYVGFLALFIGTTIIFFNDEIAEAAGFFGFPCYLVGMMEVL
jgi:hypothetical protein